MKLIKVMMVCSIFIIAIAVISCKKEQFKSRDTSGLKPPVIDTTTPPPVDTSAVISSCDKLDGWNVVNGGQLLTAGQKEGTGYIQGTIAAGGNFMQFELKLATPVNTKVTLANGELKFWFYIQDITQLKTDGQIQFSSANDPDNKRVGWGLDKVLPTCHNGWNHLELRFMDGYLSGDGGPDLTAMNYMRIFYNTTGNVAAAQIYAIDDVRADVAPPVMINNCDKLDGWNVANGGQLLTAGQKEGTGYIQGTIAAAGNFMQFELKLATPVNTKTTLDAGYFEFWFYIQDITQLKTDGQIQFSSANDPDNKRVGWGLDKVLPTCHNGWNHLDLKFTDGYLSGDGGPDLTAMNYMRIFFNTTANVATAQIYAIDDLEVHAK